MRVLTEEVKANISQEQPAEAKTALAESWNSLFSLRGCISQPFDERGSSYERNTLICNTNAKNLKSITALRSIINNLSRPAKSNKSTEKPQQISGLPNTSVPLFLYITFNVVCLLVAAANSKHYLVDYD
uniref:Uncharacterized protein n=1 Tax=Glossina brevipalpis TaxID=37001 RepID=A0A1A9W8Z2_9MUSC